MSLPSDAVILLRSRAMIGDAVMATPAVEAVRERYPGARLIFATSHIAAPLFEGDTRLDELVRLPGPGLSRGQFLRFLRDYWGLLKRERPDAHVALDAGGNLVPQLVHLASVPRRLACVGREATGRQWHRAPLWTLTDYTPTADELGTHRAHGFQRLVAQLGCDSTPRRIALQLTDEDRASGLSRLRAAGVSRGPVVALHPGANWEYRKWPVARMAEAAREFRRLGAEPLVLAASPDSEDVRYLQSEAQVTYVSTPDVRDLACVLAAADAVVANDSGPMHIASGVDTPLVALHGPNDPAIVGPDPLHAKTRALYHGLACSPCAQNTFDPSARCGRPTGTWCMEHIHVTDVVDAVSELLA